MNKDIFNAIYINDVWTQKSGPGSNPKNAKEWINVVNSFLSKDDVKTVLDVGCGDWRLGQELNLEGKVYTGVDVSSVIIEDIMQYSSDNIIFICDDIESMDIPKTDLILIKDVLMHLPFASIKTIMDKVMKKAKYALICNDFSEGDNVDILPGEWRQLDLLKPPFEYKITPLMIFNSNLDKIIHLFVNPDFNKTTL